MDESQDIDGWLRDLSDPGRVGDRPERAMLEALRQAILGAESPAPADELGLARLHARLRREGLYAHPERSTLPRWLGSAAVIVLAVGLGLDMTARDPELAELPTEPTAGARLEATAPDPVQAEPQRALAAAPPAADQVPPLGRMARRQPEAEPAMESAQFAAAETAAPRSDSRLQAESRALGLADRSARAKNRAAASDSVRLELYVADLQAARQSLQLLVEQHEQLSQFDQADYGAEGFGLGLLLGDSFAREQLQAWLNTQTPQPPALPGEKQIWLRVRPR